MNKDLYFEQLSEYIKDIKINPKINLEEAKEKFQQIKEFEDINYQDIITYMLYCFQIIEITQKWKLKKEINYEIFINNMEQIYEEVFCNSNMKLKNKIFALISLENIITKTINYGIDEYIFKVLDKYIELISSKKTYLQNTELSLLRGNLYCIIYNTLKDNIEINEEYKTYIEKLENIFNYEKFLNMAKSYFDEIINEKQISYDDLTNLLIFKIYNKIDIDEKTLDIILSQLYTNYRYEFFDKKIFSELLNKILKIKLNIKQDIEYAFEDKEIDDMIIINYNNIDCSLENNISPFINLLKKISKITLKNNKFIQTHKLIDELIEKKETNVESVINYDNLLLINSISIFKDILEQIDQFDNYFIEKVKKFYNNNYEASPTNEKKYYIDNEIFEEKYKNIEIKELIKENEILKTEYNANGNYKDIAEILKESVKEKNKSLYNNILNFRNINLNMILNDYYMLLLVDDIDTNLIKEKEKLLKQYLPSNVENSLSFYGNLPKEKFDEIFEEYLSPCIKKISQTRLNNKTFDNTKDFLNYEKSNSDNYFGICKLQEILENTINE